jgi:hypothetical protein
LSRFFCRFSRQELIITAHVVIQARVDSLTVLTPPPDKLLTNEDVASFCYRQYWSAVKVLASEDSLDRF